MENSINLTCKRAERKFKLEIVEDAHFYSEVITIKGYEVYNSNKPVCFISKDDTLGEWNANSFDDYQNCEGLCGGLTKKEVLANIERCLRQGTLYLTWDERKAKRNAELEQVAVGIDEMATEAAKVWKDYTEAKEVAELEVSEKETKSHEVWKLFNELDDDGLVCTNHYDEALCQKQNVQYHWDEDLNVEDIETVIEYFKNLKQLIALERKVSKLAIYG